MRKSTFKYERSNILVEDGIQDYLKKNPGKPKIWIISLSGEAYFVLEVVGVIDYCNIFKLAELCLSLAIANV